MILLFVLDFILLMLLFVPYFFNGFRYLFSSIGVLSLFLFHGVFLKTLLFLIFYDDDIYKNLMLSGISVAEFISWMTYFLTIFVVFQAGLLLLALKRNSRVVLLKRNFSNENFKLSVLSLFSFLVFVLFVYANQDFVSSGTKNFFATSDASNYKSITIWKIMFFVPMLVSLYAFVNYLLHGKYIGYFVIGFLIYVAFNFLADQRGGLVFYFFSILFVYYNLKKDSKLIYFYFVSFVIVAVLTYKTIIRIGSDNVFNIVLNYFGRNFIDPVKTFQIISVLEPNTGFWPYINSILILIPRVFYPDKSIFNLDTYIGLSVYGCNVFGACAVPPGLLAESYIIGGYVYLLISIFLVMLVLYIINLIVIKCNYLTYSFICSVLIYSWPSILGSGIASFITATIQSLSIYLLVLLWLKLKF